MRGLRGHSETPVSLFAFQDIMTAVIGIFLLVVLLMCLQLRQATGRVPDPRRRRETVAQLEAELSAALKAEQAAAERVEAARKTLARRHAEGQIDQVVARRRELAAIYEQIARVEQRLGSSYEALRALSRDENARRQLKQIMQLEQRKKRLQAELEEIRRHRGLTYLLNQRFPKIPLLIVASGQQVRLGLVGSDEGAITLTIADSRMRAEAVLQWLRQFSPRRYYALVVLKPSVPVEWSLALRAGITALGFSQGLDLLPEDWTVLQYSGLAEGAGP